jgi:hypothetical protein
MSTTYAYANTATEKQTALIARLGRERVGHPEAEAILADARLLWKDGYLTRVRASEVIADLLPLPKSESAAAPAEAPEGMHRFGGHIWKVQRSPETGRAYAKVLEVAPDKASGWGFTYVPGGLRNLHEGTRLSLEEAKEFGALYGTCCVCGRTLTNEESIAAGIGPVCAAGL